MFTKKEKLIKCTKTLVIIIINTPKQLFIIAVVNQYMHKIWNGLVKSLQIKLYFHQET